MRRFLFLLLLVLWLIPAHSQELTVKSFVANTSDLSASTHERKDLNGNSCALVKVQLATSGAQFSPNVMGNVEYKVNEYWVYLPTMNKHLEVKHPSFLTKDVVFADYGVKLEPKTTYSLILTMPEGGTDTQVITSQYLLFNVEPADAIVEVNGEVWTNTDGVSRKFVPFGEYSYSVEASNYHTYSGTVTVNDPNNKTIVNVNLKPAFGSVKIPYSEALVGTTVYIDNQMVGNVPYVGNTIPSGKHQVRLVRPMYKALEQEIEVRDGETTEFSPALTANFSTVTLSVENGAQIYVNDELKGSGSWTGRLEYGECNIKTQKDGHRPQTKIYTISVAQNNKKIKLAPPTPIYGSVHIDVLPDMSEVYIDNEKVGTTPLFLQKKILVGKHQIEVKKSGYLTWVDSITVEENKPYEIKDKELQKASVYTPPLTTTDNGNAVTHSEEHSQKHYHYTPDNYHTWEVSGLTYLNDKFKSYQIRLRTTWNTNFSGIFTWRYIDLGISGGVFKDGTTDDFDTEKHDDGFPLDIEDAMQLGVILPLPNDDHYFTLMGGMYGACWGYVSYGDKDSKEDGEGFFDYGIRISASFLFNKFVIGAEYNKSLSFNKISTFGVTMGLKF